VIVTGRDGSEAQRWALEPLSAPRGQGETRQKRAEDTPRESPRERTQRPHAEAPPGHRLGPPRTKSEESPQERYETRFAQVDCCEEDGPGSDETGTGLLGPATATVTDAVTALHSAALP
jgi:hypothetical protein